MTHSKCSVFGTKWRHKSVRSSSSLSRENKETKIISPPSLGSGSSSTLSSKSLFFGKPSKCLIRIHFLAWTMILGLGQLWVIEQLSDIKQTQLLISELAASIYSGKPVWDIKVRRENEDKSLGTCCGSSQMLKSYFFLAAKLFIFALPKLHYVVKT